MLVFELKNVSESITHKKTDRIEVQRSVTVHACKNKVISHRESWCRILGRMPETTHTKINRKHLRFLARGFETYFTVSCFNHQSVTLFLAALIKGRANLL